MNSKELAKLIGVSQSTISRALNGSPQILEQRRQEIIELAKKHNFEFNLNARNLRKQTSYEQDNIKALMTEKPQYASLMQFLPILQSPFIVANTSDTGNVLQRALDECYLNNADIAATLQQAQIDAQAFLDK